MKMIKFLPSLLVWEAKISQRRLGKNNVLKFMNSKGNNAKKKWTCNKVAIKNGVLDILLFKVKSPNIKVLLDLKS